MGRVRYNPEQCKHSHYLHYGSGMPVFRGEVRQVGFGLGSLLASLARTVLPVLKPVAKSFAKSALKTGGHILSDVVSGKENFKTSTKKRISQALDEQLAGNPTPKKRRKVKKGKVSRKHKDIL